VSRSEAALDATALNWSPYMSRGFPTSVANVRELGFHRSRALSSAARSWNESLCARSIARWQSSFAISAAGRSMLKILVPEASGSNAGVFAARVNGTSFFGSVVILLTTTAEAVLEL
jgi:hypothetical protein